MLWAACSKTEVVKYLFRVDILQLPAARVYVREIAYRVLFIFNVKLIIYLLAHLSISKQREH